MKVVRKYKRSLLTLITVICVIVGKALGVDTTVVEMLL